VTTFTERHQVELSTNLDDFATVNRVMESYFGKPFPARAAVGVASLPKGVDVEADAILAL
jgi:enamine deaminase RidA (YjgF/YER057c/UK114 family)